MSVSLPLAPIATFVTENPWPTVALVFLFGVILPAVWGRRKRRHAAMKVLSVALDVVPAIVTAFRGRTRS